ncbi:Lrp/AsnC family transcriptional regulator (plasmid) [Arthrobacter sp. UC242_113]|uniref:Lrp/AsnC family transcriptional regulator n=1 Tax=Arthrobacter sp. UC242_113 TaxID=3374550 RepID=UPI00375758A5
MSRGSLSDLDRELLGALRNDGRTPFASLARNLGVTRATINNRLERMLATGVIMRFSVRVREGSDPFAIHAIALIAKIDRSGHSGSQGISGDPGPSYD